MLNKVLFVALPALLFCSFQFAAPAFASPSGDAFQAHEPPAINWLDLDYKSKNPKGEKLEAGEHETMAPPLLFALINFGLLLALLGWKAGPPIREYVSGRHGNIKSALEESARLRAEAQKKLAEYSERIAGVESEVESLLKDTRASAEKEKKRILEEAASEAEGMKKAAHDRIEAEIARARSILEEEVAVAAAVAAEKILKAKTSKQDQTNMVDSFIAKIGEGA